MLSGVYSIGVRPKEPPRRDGRREQSEEEGTQSNLLREAFGVREACSRFWTVIGRATAPASWTHSKRFAQFGCGATWSQLRLNWLAVLVATGWLVFASAVQAQVRPYIGFVYPAGGQQGTTFQIKLGGQGLDGVDQIFVTGAGVTAKVLEYDRPLNPQETTLLNEQLKELKRGKAEGASMMMNSGAPMMRSESAI